jgi:hypothetical protein
MGEGGGVNVDVCADVCAGRLLVDDEGSGGLTASAFAREEPLSILSAVSIDRFMCMRRRVVELSPSPSRPSRSRLGTPPGSSVSAGPCRSRKSRSLFRIQDLRTSAHSSQPFCRASISGVIPCLSARLAWAPRRRRVVTMLVLPFAAAKWRGVLPLVPTIGAEVSRFLSFEYRRGSLGTN